MLRPKISEFLYPLSLALLKICSLSYIRHGPLNINQKPRGPLERFFGGVDRRSRNYDSHEEERRVSGHKVFGWNRLLGLHNIIDIWASSGKEEIYLDGLKLMVKDLNPIKAELPTMKRPDWWGPTDPSFDMLRDQTFKLRAWTRIMITKVGGESDALLAMEDDHEEKEEEEGTKMIRRTLAISRSHSSVLNSFGSKLSPRRIAYGRRGY
ncbi:hypothetical protein MMC10_000442 [Thelotrema lepadinum]|nr:hypothetical protein [Thelotrema lepadinum]